METNKNKKHVLTKTQIAPIIIGKLLNIGAMLQRNGNKTLLPYDLNQQQFSIFFEIAQAGKVQQKEMVNRLLLERAHVSKVVKKLLRMDLVTITLSEEDKRSSWLSPTPKGKQLLKNCMEIFEEWNKEWTDEIPEDQLSDMLDHLSMLQTIFKNKIFETK